MITNHELALRLFDLAKKDGGIWIAGDEWIPVETVQTMYNEFIARVPVIEVKPEQQMTIFGHIVTGCPTGGDPPSIAYIEKLKDHYVPREDMDSTWCVWCCHSHPSGEICGASYAHSGNAMLDNDRCGCDADHHPEESC